MKRVSLLLLLLLFFSFSCEKTKEVNGKEKGGWAEEEIIRAKGYLDKLKWIKDFFWNFGVKEKEKERPCTRSQTKTKTIVDIEKEKGKRKRRRERKKKC